MTRVVNVCPRCGRQARRTHAHGRTVQFFCKPCNTGFEISYRESEEDCEFEELNAMYEHLLQYAKYLNAFIVKQQVKIRKLENALYRECDKTLKRIEQGPLNIDSQGSI